MCGISYTYSLFLLAFFCNIVETFIYKPKINKRQLLIIPVTLLNLNRVRVIMRFGFLEVSGSYNKFRNLLPTLSILKLKLC